MEDARTGLSLQKKKEALLPFFKSFCVAYRQGHQGVGPTFNFGELLELPSVKAALEDQSMLNLPDSLIPELKAELPQLCEGRAEKLRAECLANVNEERARLGLLAFSSFCTQDEGASSSSSSKAVDVPTTDCPLLAASTTFAAHVWFYNYDADFQKVMRLFFDRLYPESVRVGSQPAPWKVPIFQRDFAKDAEEVLKGLGLPLNVTYEHMSEIAKTVRCKTCKGHPTFLWAGVVRYSEARSLCRICETNLDVV